MKPRDKIIKWLLILAPVAFCLLMVWVIYTFLEFLAYGMMCFFTLGLPRECKEYFGKGEEVSMLQILLAGASSF